MTKNSDSNDFLDFFSPTYTYNRFLRHYYLKQDLNLFKKYLTEGSEYIKGLWSQVFFIPHQLLSTYDQIVQDLHC